MTSEDSQVLETEEDVNCVVEWSDNEHVVEEIDNCPFTATCSGSGMLHVYSS